MLTLEDKLTKLLLKSTRKRLFPNQGFFLKKKGLLRANMVHVVWRVKSIAKGIALLLIVCATILTISSKLAILQLTSATLCRPMSASSMPIKGLVLARLLFDAAGTLDHGYLRLVHLPRFPLMR